MAIAAELYDAVPSIVSGSGNHLLRRQQQGFCCSRLVIIWSFNGVSDLPLVKARVARERLRNATQVSKRLEAAKEEG
jgi:hypothetical protein